MAVSQFRGRILRRMHLKNDQGCPISKAPSNVAEKCSLLFPDLKDPMAGSFTAQRILRFIARFHFFRYGVGERLVWLCSVFGVPRDIDVTGANTVGTRFTLE